MDNMENKNEIDLLSAIKIMFTAIGKGLAYLCKMIYRFVKKHFLIFLVLFVVAFVGATLTNKFSKSFYKTKLLASANVVNRKIIMDKFIELQDLIEDENFDLLSQRLNLPEDKVKLLKTIYPQKYDIKWELDSGFGKDFKILQVDVEVWNYTIIPDLEVAFKHYINNDLFIKSQVGQVQQGNLEMQKAIESQIEQLKELQTVTISQMKSAETQKGQLVIVNKEPVKSFYEEIVTLNDKLMLLKSEYASNDPLKIIQSLNVYRSPVSVFWKYFCVYIVVLWIAGIIAGVVIDNKQKKIK